MQSHGIHKKSFVYKLMDIDMGMDIDIDIGIDIDMSIDIDIEVLLMLMSLVSETSPTSTTSRSEVSGTDSTNVIACFLDDLRALLFCCGGSSNIPAS